LRHKEVVATFIVVGGYITLSLEKGTGADVKIIGEIPVIEEKSKCGN